LETGRNETQTEGDDDLIRRVAKGDKLAMKVLFARHNVRVFRFILRFGVDQATAEDLVSDVFLDIWRQAGRFEFRSSATTWMLGMARFKVLSSRRQRRETVDSDDAMAELADDEDTPEVAAQKRSKADALRECLNALSEDHKEVVDLVYYHDKSIKEVAEIVGVPENTVKTRMFHARKKLSEIMRRAGIDRGWP